MSGVRQTTFREVSCCQCKLFTQGATAVVEKLSALALGPKTVWGLTMSVKK